MKKNYQVIFYRDKEKKSPDKKIIITNGFIKKTQKTPSNEIELAKKYKNEYIERNKKK